MQLLFSNPSRDKGGLQRCTVQVHGVGFHGEGELQFHPGEHSLVEFLRGVVDEPPRYRDDRWFGLAWDRTVHGARFCIGRHDGTRLGLSVSIRQAETEVEGGGPPAMWELTAYLILEPAQLVALANELSQLFGYDQVG